MARCTLVLICICVIEAYSFVAVNAVPPEACFANFRWDDCGKPPTPVMYYWKPGSRCEVGMWRGCLPNINMFADEYECVATCIYTARAMPEDYHNHFIPDESPYSQDLGLTTPSEGNVTESAGTTLESSNTTTSIGGETESAGNVTSQDTASGGETTVTAAT